MLIHRANRYSAEPDAALVQWVGACRYVSNLCLEQRRDLGRGRSLNYTLQARELTMLRVSMISVFGGVGCALFDCLVGVDSRPDAIDDAVVLAAVKDASRR